MALISGCSEAYKDIETEFGNTEFPNNSVTLATKTFSVSSKHHRGVETFRDIASVSISSKGVSLDAGTPFSKRVLIPTSEIAGCAMTCFGTNDQRVNLLVPKTGTNVMVASSDELLNWCWANKKPMFSGKAKRDWLYSDAPLPPPGQFEEQFKSRQKFDKQKEQSCLGY